MIADLSFFGLTVFRRDPTKNNNRCPPVACQSARPIVPKTEQPDAVVVLSESFPSRVDLYFY